MAVKETANTGKEKEELGLCISQWEMVFQKMARVRSTAFRAPNITHFDGAG
jgi:hypothetical protein